ncbi:poly depolymerase [Xylariales sp. AK1849]|nr:poly depolymerase [Xylariales sp. AK1849]
MLLFAVISIITTGVVAASSGCGKAPSFDVGHLSDNQTTQDDRRYRVFVPESYDKEKATPLILSYHGANQQIEDQVALDGLTTPLFNTENIVVYLQGSADDPKEPTHTSWQGAPDNDADDYGFTTSVLDALQSALCIDTNRIYATGKSQGGGFVGRLACHATLSKQIAAFAPVSGAYYIKQLSRESSCADPETVAIPCDTDRRGIPILAFHGGADDVIEYWGGFRSDACLPSVRHWAREWVSRNGLQMDSEVNSTIKNSDNGVVSSWGNGAVTLVYDGDNIKHAWPSTGLNADNAGNPKAAFNATSRILDFFGGHALP